MKPKILDFTISSEAIRNCPSVFRGDWVKETGGSNSFMIFIEGNEKNHPSVFRGDWVKETGGSFTCQ